MAGALRGPALRSGVLALGAAPLLALIARARWGDGLGANPIEEITHTTGDWALRFLLLSLGITPARRWLGWGALAPLRRTLGLIAFGYASLHFATWVALDQAFDVDAMLQDVLERPWVSAGFCAWLLLLPLAATSTRAAARRLGAARWRRLHRLVWVALGAALLHYAWLVKADLLGPALHAAAAALLIVARVAAPLRRGAEPH